MTRNSPSRLDVGFITLKSDANGSDHKTVRTCRRVRRNDRTTGHSCGSNQAITQDCWKVHSQFTSEAGYHTTTLLFYFFPQHPHDVLRDEERGPTDPWKKDLLRHTLKINCQYWLTRHNEHIFISHSAQRRLTFFSTTCNQDDMSRSDSLTVTRRVKDDDGTQTIWSNLLFWAYEWCLPLLASMHSWSLFSALIVCFGHLKHNGNSIVKLEVPNSASQHRNTYTVLKRKMLNY